MSARAGGRSGRAVELKRVLLPTGRWPVSREAALLAAQAAATDQGFAWTEPIRVRRSGANWWVLTNADHRGGNLNVRVDGGEGAVRRIGFARRQSHALAAPAHAAPSACSPGAAQCPARRHSVPLMAPAPVPNSGSRTWDGDAVLPRHASDMLSARAGNGDETEAAVQAVRDQCSGGRS